MIWPRSQTDRLKRLERAKPRLPKQRARDLRPTKSSHDPPMPVHGTKWTSRHVRSDVLFGGKVDIERTSLTKPDL